MEQHRTRPSRDRARRTAPLPPQASGPSAAVGRPPAARGSGSSGAGSARGGAGAGTLYRAARRPRRPGPPLFNALRQVVGAVRKGVLAVRALPNPRLTGLGSGLFCTAAMLLLACIDRLLFSGSPVVYGVLFLLVSALTSVWVRPADLVTAPVAVPIAFAVGLLPITGGADGFGGQIMGLVTALAVHAGWVYGGTLVAGLIVTVRKVKIMNRKRALRAARAPQRRRMPAQP